MKGVFFSSELPELCEIRDFEIPQPGADEVLVKNAAVASNPKDWKMPMRLQWQAIEGNDIAGYIEAVGSKVTGFKKGDKVAAFTKMTTDTKYGAYAEYTVAPSHTAWHLADSTSFEEAATVPLAMMTAALGLFVHLGLETPSTSGSSRRRPGEIVLIYGATSSVGAFAVQLATRAGYSVVGVAGHMPKL
ncbi:MAG: hypothetical protein CYPHOPRED_004058 [Cyphobasidiales sp. Tagirdzhanova-0007]|nr:MAG: hypothetical protein CYPHOPRED_004058 [Cyphobasidiales sp. Tagirdzhanova-0007]